MSIKIAAVSDTHGRPFTIPKADLFIHCGDMTAGGSLGETKDFADFIRTNSPCAWNIICVGNHDKCFEDDWESAASLFDARCFVVNNQSVTITVGDETIKLWISGFTPPFMRWSFMATEEELAKMYLSMPDELDILVTHGPPRGILDTGYQDPHVGSIALAEALEWRNVKHNVFGHLHSCGGQSVQPYFEGTTYHNVAACDDAYKLVRQPIIIEL